MGICAAKPHTIIVHCALCIVHCTQHCALKKPYALTHTALIMLLYHSSTVRSFFVCGSLKRNTTAIVVNTISGTMYEPL